MRWSMDGELRCSHVAWRSTDVSDVEVLLSAATYTPHMPLAEGATFSNELPGGTVVFMRRVEYADYRPAGLASIHGSVDDMYGYRYEESAF